MKLPAMTFQKIASSLLAATFLSAAPAHALLFRAYLASDGSDANPCTLQLPCRLLPAALVAVESGGEIWMLDSANYNTGTVVIGKSVAIRAIPGAVGSIVVLGGDGLQISADALVVSLSNLAIGPVATSPPLSTYRGIFMSGNSTLNLDGCVVGYLPGDGVRVSDGRLNVVDSLFRKLGTALNVQSIARAAISGSRFLGNNTGVLVYGTNGGDLVSASVSDSVIAGTGSSDGVVTSLNALSATSRLVVTRTQIYGHQVGARAMNLGGQAGTSMVSLSNNTITGNTYPMHQAGTGTSIFSMGNNHVADNSLPAEGTITPMGGQ